MNTEISALLQRFENVLSGDPWYGRSVYSLLDQVDAHKTSISLPGTTQTLIALLWHMNHGALFCLKRILYENNSEMNTAEAAHKKTPDANLISWEQELALFKKLHVLLADTLIKRNDTFLDEIVDTQKFTFRFMLHGLADHHIYHAGQVAMLYKQLK